MRRSGILGILLTTCLWFAAFTVHAAHTQVKLLLSDTTMKPGDTVLVGVDMQMDPGWHTYWKNPGAAGIATTIQWHLPPGVTAGKIQWPIPKKLPPAEVTTYGYEGENMLVVPLKLAANLKPGPLEIKADVAWLECKEQCIPASTTVEATLNIGDRTEASADAATIKTWQAKAPIPAANWSVKAWWEKPANEDTRPIIIDVQPITAGANGKCDSVDFFPAAYDNFEVQAKTEILSATSADIRLRKSVKKYSGDWPKTISGVIVVEKNGSRTGYAVNIPVSDEAPAKTVATVTSTPAANAASPAPPARLPSHSLGKMLVYAFVGGLILNIMPCVLPVISLKILGFVTEARSEPRRVRLLGLIYTIGVLVSFLALAAIVISVKVAGDRPGWGMQFGNPIFLVCLTTLVTLVALNLFGVFEVTLGGRALDAAGALAARHGAPGAFFNGVLATALATPCTAPFLSTALGFAFLQPATTIILIFLAVGLGLAAPYVLLSWNPAWLKFLPKPGAWMEKFKIAMGFPMLLTAIWLFNLASDDYGKNVLWLGIFLVIVAMAAWIFGEFFQRGRRHKGFALIIALVLLTGGYAYALEDQLHWREPVITSGSTGSLSDSADGIDWQHWSPAAVTAARKAGHPVLVDFTADWCLTCQVNKKTSIETSSVRNKLKAMNAVAFVGDYTHFPGNITTELNHFGRAGVPLVLVYPKNTADPPVVLPEILTPGIVLNALDQVSR